MHIKPTAGTDITVREKKKKDILLELHVLFVPLKGVCTRTNNVGAKNMKS